MQFMLLIFPPVAKPSEPPAGIARLSAALRSHGIPCQVLDANLEGLLYLTTLPSTASDTWGRRAAKNISGNIRAMREIGSYRSPDRYSRAVKDINRLLGLSSASSDATAGLADYRHSSLSPLKSSDLLFAAEHPEQDPFYPYFKKRLTDIFETDSFECVGFSLNYLSQALTTFAMIGFVRKRFPESETILGGGLVTSWMNRPGWKDVFAGLVDQLIAGPGESQLLEMFGINDEQRNRAAPEYDEFPLGDYFSPGFILPYNTADGCYWNRCSFCPERAEGNLYRPIPTAQALCDIRAAAAETKPVLLHLLDSAVSTAMLKSIIRTPPGIPWYGFARFSPELADPDFCRELKLSGCVMLKLGLESGDQNVLDRLQKGIDLNLASTALHNLHQAGIGVYLYLLFGTPVETEEEARKTLDFVVKHRASINFINAALFNMPINDHLDGDYETEPFYDGDLSLYTGFVHPKGWGRQQVRHFITHEFKRHPAVASILKNDPPIFTSNHAPFFVGL